MPQSARSHQHSSFAIVSGLLLLLFSLPAIALAQKPEGPWSRLLEKAQDQGHTRVIVRLAEGSPLSKNLSTPQARSSRQQSVQSLQKNFIRNYETAGFRADHYKRFKYLPFLAMDVDSNALKALQNSPWITRIEEDSIEFANLSSSVPLIGGDQVIAQGFDGTGWTVAILDTGVDKTHSFLGGRVVAEACFSTTSGFSNSTSVCPGGVEESTAVGSGINCDANDPTIDCDHGTHVAGIASGNGASSSGVAPGSNIVSIQVFSKFNSASSCSPRSPPCVASFRSDQILGLEHVLSLTGSFNMASANMSLGGGGSSTPCDASEGLRKTAIDNLRAVNVATVIASGNNGSSNSISFPACISTAISVGSTTKSDNISSFSNRDDFLSLMAPGSSIRSSTPGENFQFFNGTSMAAPHVAGVWAVLKEAMASQGLQGSVDEILAALQATGTPIEDASTGINYPRINIDDALDTLLAPKVLNDFNGDGTSDLLIHNTALGHIGVGLVESGVVQSGGLVLTADPALGWTLNSTGDFNGDRKADLLLFNTTTGAIRTVLLDGSSIISDFTVMTLDPIFGLEPQGTADTDGDGQSEILLFNPTTGLLVGLVVNDSIISAAGVITTIDVGNFFTLTDTGDFDGDGKDDLYVTSTNNALAYVPLDGLNPPGAQVTLFTFGPLASQRPVGVGDFNENGLVDVLISDIPNPDPAGTLSVGLQDGVTIVSDHNLSDNFSVDLKVLNASDYDGDGKTDVLLFNTVSGQAAILLMDGTTPQSVQAIAQLDLANDWTLHSGKP